MTRILKHCMFSALALCAMVSIAGTAFADGLTARTSAAEVAEGDTFQLVLSGDAGTLSAAPDLTPLGTDFDVLSTGQSRQTQIINGARSDTVQWTVTLAPKAPGALTIPAIQAGAANSDPIQIEVLDPATMPVVTVPGAPEVSVTLADGTHYVQQEIPVQVRITAGPNLQSGELVLPQSPDFTLTQSGEDQISRANANGTSVTTTTRTYMLRPQVDGTLTLPPITLKAVISDPNARGPFAGSPFQDMLSQFPGRQGGNDPFARMFNQGREVSVRSAPITLEVKPNPAGQGSWFLPAKEVQISAKWLPEAPDFKVGEAVIRKIQVMAMGATETQLPDISISSADGLRIYSEGSQARSVDTEQGTAAVREFSFSVVPTTGGELTFPAVSVDWFDTATETAQSAILPAETFSVQGAPLATTATTEPQTSSSSAGAVDNPVQTGSFLRWWIGGLVALLVGIAAVVLFWLKKAKADEGPFNAAQNRRSAVEKARAAAQKSDLSGLHAAVGAWVNLANKGRIQPDASRLSGLMKQWHDLERTLYSGASDQAASFDGKALVAALATAEQQLTSAEKDKNKRATVLAPLYNISQDHGLSPV